MNRLLFICIVVAATCHLYADNGIGNLFSMPGVTSGKNQDSGPTTITANSMDIDFKNNIITLIGNCKVEDSNVVITSEKMLVYLQDKKQSGGILVSSNGGKTAKAAVALGNVVIIQKNIPKNEAKSGERKAAAGRADYDLINGIIILTENPILYQGDNYIRGNRIILWKESDRMKVEGGETPSSSSIVVLNQNPNSLSDTSVQK